MRFFFQFLLLFVLQRLLFHQKPLLIKKIKLATVVKESITDILILLGSTILAAVFALLNAAHFGGHSNSNNFIFI